MPWSLQHATTYKQPENSPQNAFGFWGKRAKHGLRQTFKQPQKILVPKPAMQPSSFEEDMDSSGKPRQNS